MAVFLASTLDMIPLLIDSMKQVSLTRIQTPNAGMGEWMETSVIIACTVQVLFVKQVRLWWLGLLKVHSHSFTICKNLLTQKPQVDLSIDKIVSLVKIKPILISDLGAPNVLMLQRSFT